jgi:hypothetical protein
MNITILGYKIRVELIILSILLIWFIHTNTFFSCAGGVKPGVNVIKEGMAVMEGITTATAQVGAKAMKENGKKAAKAVINQALMNKVAKK